MATGGGTEASHGVELSAAPRHCQSGWWGGWGTVVEANATGRSRQGQSRREETKPREVRGVVAAVAGEQGVRLA